MFSYLVLLKFYNKYGKLYRYNMYILHSLYFNIFYLPTYKLINYNKKYFIVKHSVQFNLLNI